MFDSNMALHIFHMEMLSISNESIVSSCRDIIQVTFCPPFQSAICTRMGVIIVICVFVVVNAVPYASSAFNVGVVVVDDCDKA